MGARLVITGGRKLEDKDLVWFALSNFHRLHDIDLLIEGGATGADRLSYEWAITNGVPHRRYDAKWTLYGKAAGGIRNQVMIDRGKPTDAMIFPGNTGTADMFERVKKAGIPYWEIKSDAS